MSSTSNSQSAVDIETVVIGAGVVGLATARALANSGREVCVLEANADIGHGISSRNSEVIHAGIYYPKDSLKARLCVAGKHLLYEYCNERQISAKAVGKLIVATDDSETEALKAIQHKALNNGVSDIELIDAGTAMARQPQLNCTAALLSPSTGIVDSHSLMISLQGDVENNGGMVVCQSPVEEVSENNGVFTLTIGEPSSMDLRCRELINCSGLFATDIARRLKTSSGYTVPAPRFAKGNYFKLQGKAPFDMLIYPAPVTGGLGVHLTIDLAGQARFGPDVEWLDGSDLHDYGVDPGRSISFYEAIRKYWPALADGALQADYAGIRPKIEGTTDFLFHTESQHGVKGLVNLLGIESPGLTSSLAIGEYVTQLLQELK